MSLVGNQTELAKMLREKQGPRVSGSQGLNLARNSKGKGPRQEGFGIGQLS